MRGGRAAEDFFIAGQSFNVWVDLYNWFDRTGQWPDGRPSLDQPQIVTEVFTVLSSQVAKEQEHKVAKRKRN